MTDDRPTVIRSVLRHLDVEELNAAARQESRSRQLHLRPISAYRWWARRTETVSGAVIDAVSADLPGGLLIADPFAGGGVIALAALLRGHRVYAQDVNPWAARSLSTMLGLPAHEDLAAAADRLHSSVEQVLNRAYGTSFADGSPAEIAHTMRVATAPCPGCGKQLRLFPTALVSMLNRVDSGGDTGYVACPAGHIGLASVLAPTRCRTCRRPVRPTERYTSGRRGRCVECGWHGCLSELAGATGFAWEIVLVERVGPERCEIGLPSADEIAAACPSAWVPSRQLPPIDPGMESYVLIRHGMTHWHDLFPKRQRVVIESLLSACDDAGGGDPRVSRALEAAVIGSTEMAGHTSRWDARYLKAYEAVANHRFSFTTFAVEPNVWGSHDVGRGTVERRLDQLAKAVLWLEERIGHRLVVDGPKSATGRRTVVRRGVDARVVSGSSSRLCIASHQLDAVVTDSAYHDDVQYGELSDLFRAWAGETTGALEGDAVVRRRNDRSGTDAYRDLLTSVFREIHRALRPGGHLVLSYANRQPAAWVALFAALQAASFEAVGYTVVHSENETDHAKAGRRACNLDVLIDLVPAGSGRLRRHQPQGDAVGDEAAFCHLIGRHALSVGHLPDGWADSFCDEVRNAPFLS